MSDIDEDGSGGAVCGREQADWSENEGEGIVVAGIIYCSVDCAQRDQGR
jgi:hypothetical protein